jgi:1,2-diacylglycerol 3-beta-glucosyltransferase
MASLFLTAALAVVTALSAGSVIYLLILLVAAACPPPRRKPSSGASSVPPLVFAIVIPAHDEELVLAATLSSLALQTYPQSLQEILVVADNCTDATASIAHAHGATVLEREDQVKRGKGYALDWALTQILTRSCPPDACVIVDADTWVAPDFLERMAARLSQQTDSRGFCAVQGRYGVLNADEGWRAALMAAAFDLFNHVKPLGRERLRLGVGLKGNGMALTRALLLAAPWSGESVTEDIDYGLNLARHLGVRVCYAQEAVVRAQMPTTGRQAASQRSRWEGGRYQLLIQHALPLLLDGLRRRSVALCDAAVDLMLLPLAELAGFIALGLFFVIFGLHAHLLHHAHFWALTVISTAVGLIVYVLGGLRISGASRVAYTALLRAPFYAAWKFGLYGTNLIRRRRGSTAWVRTERAPIVLTEAEKDTP